MDHARPPQTDPHGSSARRRLAPGYGAMSMAFGRMRERLGDRTKDPRSRIEVRRFAGPAKHTEQLTRPLRIAHLTDQHVGRVTPMSTQLAAVALTNAAEPDLVVITGDFVCHSQEHLDALREVTSGFDAPVVGVLGNHDYWSGGREVAHTLDRAGALLLRNQHTVLELGHERLQVVGLDDAYTGHADRDKAVKGLRRDLPALALSHIAEEADGLWASGVPLVLSGHTHAGQVTLARLNELALGKLMGHRYVHGLYGCRRGDAYEGAVYVGAGIGAAVIPVRLGERARREVTIFELGAASQDDEHHAEQAPHPGRAPSARKKAKRVAQVQRKAAQRGARRGE